MLVEIEEKEFLPFTSQGLEDRWILDGIFQSSVNRKEYSFILWLKGQLCLLLLLFSGAEEKVVQQ